MQASANHVQNVQRTSSARRINPFATRFVRPGAIPFQFGDGTDPQMLIDQLAASNWRGAIVGPHGSGKSTLLATLIPRIEQGGRRVKHVTLCSDGTISSDGRPASLPAILQELKSDSGCLLVVDGWEQLNWLSRYRVRKRTARRNCGLLVTAHDPALVKPLPLLFRTTPSLGTMQLLVEQFLQSDSNFVSTVVSQEDVSIAFSRHQGNIRDAFFALYDLFERQAHSAHRATTAIETARM
jgi:energy-coupling factor transporter ATP-binding protein EcfA2